MQDEHRPVLGPSRVCRGEERQLLIPRGLKSSQVSYEVLRCCGELFTFTYLFLTIKTGEVGQWGGCKNFGEFVRKGKIIIDVQCIFIDGS